jgi:hypothetical protein
MAAPGTRQKSKTEKSFEAYLSQRRVAFDYEPFGRHEKNPDYRFVKNKKTILVEIKEIGETPFQREAAARLVAHNSGAFSVDPRELYKLLRRRINDAYKQLRPHQSGADGCVIILGQKAPHYEIGPDSIFYAMYGDPYLSFPIDPIRGGAIGEATTELKVNGAVRQNRRSTREMHSPHPYLSAVGVVEEFNGRGYYERKFYEALPKKHRPPTAEGYLAYLTSEWEKHQDKIPALYREDKMFYRVRLVANPLSEKPLPPNIFNGRWDAVRHPTVINL